MWDDRRRDQLDASSRDNMHAFHSSYRIAFQFSLASLRAMYKTTWKRIQTYILNNAIIALLRNSVRWFRVRTQRRRIKMSLRPIFPFFINFATVLDNLRSKLRAKLRPLTRRCNVNVDWMSIVILYWRKSHDSYFDWNDQYFAAKLPVVSYKNNSQLQS